MKGSETVFEQITAKKFLKQTWDTKPQVQETL